IDGSQLVYSGFSSEGFDLYAMPFDPQTFKLAQPAANARPDSPPNLDGDTDSPDSVVGAGTVPMITRTSIYKPWKYMYPRQWTISFSSDAFRLGRAVYLTTTI